MLKRLVRVVIVFCLLGCLLGLGGYTFKKFAEESHLKNPYTVLSPLFNKNKTVNNTTSPSVSPIPTITSTETQPTDTPNTPKPTTDYSNEYIDENGNLKDRHSTENIPTTVTISIDGKEQTLTELNTLSFINWLENNYTDDSEVLLVPETQQLTIITPTTTEGVTPTVTGGVTPTLPVVNGEVKYDLYLTNEEDLAVMVQSIRVIKSLPSDKDAEWSTYNRDDFEKPVVSYKLNGHTYNRNDYAWKTSSFFDSSTFTYTCPYTGTVITDLDDGKQDYDFANLDYDHIVPLKSAYLRGARDWSNEKKNEFAYDQLVGIDVLGKANRSKSDKGPTKYMPTENIEDYCYAWLYLCSYYDLAMTQEEIDVCVSHIKNAFSTGETVEFLGAN